MNRSPLLSIHRAGGARLREGTEASEVLTFGDVPAEYASAAAASVMFDQCERERIDVAGADAAVFLHRLLANDVKALAVGNGNRNLLLSSKGKVLFDFDLARETDRLRLSLPRSYAKPMLGALDTYVFSERVEIADRSHEHAPIDLCGPAARQALEQALGRPMPTGDHDWITVDLDARPVTATALRVAGSPGFRVDGGPELAPVLWSRLREAGVRPAGIVARDILRIEACSALLGADIDDTVYPQEARLEDAFSLDKGCYIGQEVVAKIDTYGGLNKRLCALRVSHDDPVPAGTRLLRDDAGERRDLGVVTSWCYSFVLDTGLVLGYVKRRHQAVGTSFHLGESDARAVIVPVPVRSGAVPLSGEFE